MHKSLPLFLWKSTENAVKLLHLKWLSIEILHSIKCFSCSLSLLDYGIASVESCVRHCFRPVLWAYQLSGCDVYMCSACEDVVGDVPAVGHVCSCMYWLRLSCLHTRVCPTWLVYSLHLNLRCQLLSAVCLLPAIPTRMIHSIAVSQQGFSQFVKPAPTSWDSKAQATAKKKTGWLNKTHWMEKHVNNVE